MAYNSIMNTVYNHYLTTYAPKKTSSQYDTHKKSELRSIYNSMVKLNKDAPLYLFDTSKESREFAVGLKENAKKYQKWQDFLMASISKTYTKARIQRTCMFILLQITKEQIQENNQFNQVIVSGFDSIGQEFLKGKHVITKFKELPKFLQDIELKCQYLCFDTFKARKVIYYDR